MNVSFVYDEEVIEFDETGDPPGRYDIMNYQKLEDGSFDYVQVGSWNNRSLLWNNSRSLQLGRNGRSVKSVCSEECPRGQYKVSRFSIIGWFFWLPLLLKFWLWVYWGIEASFAGCGILSICRLVCNDLLGYLRLKLRFLRWLMATCRLIFPNTWMLWKRN